jgi:thiol-disulfide isomerase/thioredoxin
MRVFSLKAARIKKLLLLVITFSACSLFSSAEYSGLLEKSAPKPLYTALNDQSLHTFEEFNGKPIAVMFWAEWCAFSKPAIEEFNDLAKEIGKERMHFIAISIDEYDNQEAVRERVQVAKLDHLTHAFSGNGIFDESYISFKGKDLPHLFLVSPGGNIIAESHSVGEIEDAIEEMQ